MSNYETILAECSDDGVLRITLNRPEKLNAITDTMWRELIEVLSRTRQDPQVRVVVLTGSGRGFCSGADLSPGPRDPDRPHLLWKMRYLEDAAMLLHHLPQPTIARVDGVAAGAGCNLAIGCDLIVASDRASFSEIFSQRGLTPDLAGSWLLPRLTGLHKAKEIVFFGKVLSAAEAERLGIVNHVVPVDELDAFVDDWVKQLCNLSPVALAQAKSLLNRATLVSISDALEAEGAAQAINHATQDTGEAMAAYFEKRPPRFIGR